MIQKKGEKKTEMLYEVRERQDPKGIKHGDEQD